MQPRAAAVALLGAVAGVLLLKGNRGPGGASDATDDGADASGRIPEAMHTRLTPDEARQVLGAALRHELGRSPTSAELGMLLAQSALETAHWQSMFNWNFGNSVVGSSGAHWFTLRNDADRPLEQRHHYRVFPDAFTGAAYYVHLLHARFPEAYDLLGSGDSLAFAQALKKHGYYEAPVSTYAAGLAQTYRAYA